MSREITFQFPLVHGLHARPSSHLQAVANRFIAEIRLLNARTGRSANAKSVLSLVSTDIAMNDPCVLSICGLDEEAAERELGQFLRKELPNCDEPMSDGWRRPQDQLLLPRSLRAAGLQEFFRGAAVSSGIGWGKVVLLNGLSLSDDAHEGRATDPDEEQASFEKAREALRATFQDRIAASDHAQEAGVLRAHLAILNDVALSEKVAALIAREGRSAGQSVRAAAEYFIAVLRDSASLYLRERVLDIQDVCGQLLDLLAARDGRRSESGNGNGNGNGSADGAAVRLEQPSVCIANRLTPGQFLALDR